MNHFFIASVTLLGSALASTANAASEATVIFAQPGTVVIDAAGVSRPVKRGDVINTNERLSTPPGAISQLKLLDGSLLAVRPDSEIKISPPPASANKDLQVVSLTKGTVRVLGAELMDDKKPSRFTLQSGLASLQLKGADLESSIAQPTAGAKPAGNPEPGSYNRMLVGTGSIGSGTTVTPLEPRQVSFVGTSSLVPTTFASMPTRTSSIAPSPILNAPTPTLAPPPTGTPLLKPNSVITVPVAIAPPVVFATPIAIPTPVVIAPPIITTPIFIVKPPVVTPVLKCFTNSRGQRICS